MRKQGNKKPRSRVASCTDLQSIFPRKALFAMSAWERFDREMDALVAF
jgi:hypothetical protein